jgi:porphobilinogen synthase
MIDLLNRPRRLRSTPAIRRMVRETIVTVDDLLYPMFVTQEKESSPIVSMPGIARFTVDDICRQAEQAVELGIPSIMLFGIPEHKDEIGSSGYAENGIIPTAIKAIRKAVGKDLVIVPDICMCEYTSHGHCGIIENGDVVNDATVDLLVKAALCYADAGADMVAPSDMMDGRIQEMRRGLDQHGYTNMPIMAYSAKFSSGFYGPFRDAAGSTPQFGDRQTYQMPHQNRREAMREVELDIAEGADIVMVKPGLAYLDILRDAREKFDVPLAVYNVSGEYAMVKAAAANGWIDEARVVDETLGAFKRAGADVILTYHAMDFARRHKK